MLLGRLPKNPALDEKGRLTIPSRIREAVGGEGESVELFLGHLLDKCLYLHTDEQHEAFLEAFEGAVDDTVQNRRLKSMLHAAFVPVQTDKAGRINIPAELLERAGIVKEVVVIGMRDRIELWGAEVFRGMSESSESEFREGLEAALARVAQRRRQQGGEGE